ncbi:hypothetical protein Tco_0313574 [Tanacetum coccineum]
MRFCFQVIDWYDLVDSDHFSLDEYDALLEDLRFNDGGILFSHFRIPGKSLDEGFVLLMSKENLVNVLKYVPRYKEIEVDIKNGVSSIESHMMEARLSQGKGMVIEEILEHNVVETVAGKEGKLLLLEWKDSNQVRNVVDVESEASISKPAPLFERCNPYGEKIGTRKAYVLSFTKFLVDIDCVLEHTSDRLMDKCSQAKYMQDGIHNASISGGVEAEKYILMELDQDLFQQDNAVDVEDYTNMLDELQQGNEDVVLGNIDQENEDVVFNNNDQDVDEEVVEREKHVVEETREAEDVVESDFHHDADEELLYVTYALSIMYEDYDGRENARMEVYQMLNCIKKR